MVLSADLGEHNDVRSNLPAPVQVKAGVELLKADAPYRASNDIADFKQPFAEQFRTSPLKRVASKAPQWASELVINHRNKAGIHEIAAAIGYHGRMESSYDPSIPNATVDAIHRHLSSIISRAGSKKEDYKPLFNNCIVITNEGQPHHSRTRLSNTSQVRIALHEAATLQQHGICGPDGRLIKIAILTPYKSTLQHLRREFNAMSPYEIHKDSVELATIDGYQGDQCAFVINVWVVDAKAGFLWDPSKLLVASSRPVYGRIDIVHEDLLSKKGPKRSHWRALQHIAKYNNALIRDGRNWEDLDPQSFKPRLYRGSPEVWCMYHANETHHTRTCLNVLKKGSPGLSDDSAQNYNPFAGKTPAWDDKVRTLARLPRAQRQTRTGASSRY